MAQPSKVESFVLNYANVLLSCSGWLEMVKNVLLWVKIASP
jgi:hypothetical protein